MHSSLEVGMILQEATTCIIIDKAIHSAISIILNNGSKAGLKQDIIGGLLNKIWQKVYKQPIKEL